MQFDPGLEIRPVAEPLGFRYGPGCFGPEPEIRTLDAIRESLRDPGATGPADVYAIAMDVGRVDDRSDLTDRHLVFGVVTYSSGMLGAEPVRSQGHVHVASERSGWSTPEVYEIWDGRACILMQESDADDPGRCFAVYADPGDVVIVPPGWAHATINADPSRNMTFGAWCDRAYGYIYEGVRAHGGLAWFPIVRAGGELRWSANTRYTTSKLDEKPPRAYADLGLEAEMPVYVQYETDHNRFDFVPDPQTIEHIWNGFVP